MKQKITVTLRGTEQYHMENYLVAEGFVKKTPGIFKKDGCECHFSYQRKINMGMIEITEVQLIFIGDSKIQEEADRFKLKFMTAGG